MNKGAKIVLALAMTSSMSFAGKNVIIAEDPVMPVSVGGFYIGAGVSLISADYTMPVYITGLDFVDKEFGYEWTAGMVLAGYKFNDYISIEGRYTKSTGDATYNKPTEGDPLVYSEFDHTSSEFENIAIYLKPTYQFGDLSVYGLLGYGKTTINWVDATENSDSSFQYGIGAAFNLNENLSVFADYVVMYDDDQFDDIANDINGLKEFKIDAVTVGLAYTF